MTRGDPASGGAIIVPGTEALASGWPRPSTAWHVEQTFVKTSAPASRRFRSSSVSPPPRPPPPAALAGGGRSRFVAMTFTPLALLAFCAAAMTAEASGTLNRFSSMKIA